MIIIDCCFVKEILCKWWRFWIFGFEFWYGTIRLCSRM